MCFSDIIEWGANVVQWSKGAFRSSQSIPLSMDCKPSRITFSSRRPTCTPPGFVRWPNLRPLVLPCRMPLYTKYNPTTTKFTPTRSSKYYKHVQRWRVTRKEWLKFTCGICFG
ncbi:uncharacterized protein LOC113372898 [Ctenocephalides felis]|uniref:uncharacterized protein LOC113372898 n=1 Tax=Ctenocephalides felis TaxID=7515 RepID=UPI000E6E4283|nr:uncharacterized protein LOC113372898 [Ctenocephalides felis]